MGTLLLSHTLMSRLKLSLMSMLRSSLSHTLMSRFQLSLTSTLSQLLPQSLLTPQLLMLLLPMPQLLMLTLLLMPLPQLLMLLTLLLMPLPQLLMLDTLLPPHTLDTDTDMPQLLTQHWLLPQFLLLLKLPYQAKTKDYIQRRYLRPLVQQSDQQGFHRQF